MVHDNYLFLQQGIQFLSFGKDTRLNHRAKPVTIVSCLPLEKLQSIKGYSTSLVCYILKQIHNIQSVDSLQSVHINNTLLVMNKSKPNLCLQLIFIISCALNIGTDWITSIFSLIYFFFLFSFFMKEINLFHI